MKGFGAGYASALEAAVHADDLEGLQGAMTPVLEEMGFGPPTYFQIGGHDSHILPRVVFGEPCDRWIQHYYEQAYVRYDVLAAMCVWSEEAFTWSEAESASKRRGFRRMLSDARALWAPEMLVCPVRGEGGTIGCVSLPVSTATTMSRHQKRAGHAIASLFSCLGQSLVQDEGRHPLGAQASLTRREQDCIYWVAMGKSDGEIAELLSISPNTAHHQIQSAKAKLDASSRIVMIRRAAAAGLIVKPS